MASIGKEEAPDFAGQARAAILEALGNVAQQKAGYVCTNNNDIGTNNSCYN